MFRGSHGKNMAAKLCGSGQAQKLLSRSVVVVVATAAAVGVVVCSSSGSRSRGCEKG